MKVHPNILSKVVLALRPHLKRDVVLTADTELTSAGLIDSLGLMQLTLDLERRMGIRLGAADLEFDHFATVGTLAARLAELGAKS